MKKFGISHCLFEGCPTQMDNLESVNFSLPEFCYQRRPKYVFFPGTYNAINIFSWYSTVCFHFHTLLKWKFLLPIESNTFLKNYLRSKFNQHRKFFRATPRSVLKTSLNCFSLIFRRLYKEMVELYSERQVHWY